MNNNDWIPEDDHQLSPEPGAEKTPDEAGRKRVDYYLRKHMNLQAEMTERKETWIEIDDLVMGNREADNDSDPNTCLNVMLPNIEGQVASMTNHEITGAVRGNGVSDQKFAKSAQPVVNLIMKENDIKGCVKDAARRYLKFGNAAITVNWDPDALDGFGMPILEMTPIDKLFFDGKVKHQRLKENADFIIREVGSVSITHARRKWGDEKARMIQLGNSEPSFAAANLNDDDDAFTLLHVWTKDNEYGNLQLIEMSLCGVLLSESDPKEPYHTYVFNKYPVFISGLYQKEGEFYRYGDGQAMKPVQEIINKLYDEIILAVKFSSQGRTYADPNSGLNPDEFAECDPRKPIYVSNPTQMIVTERGVGINTVVFELLGQLIGHIQTVTRFHNIMTGQGGGSRVTATQTGIQMQQGNTGIDDKRSDISRMFGDAIAYAVGLCMEHWSAAKAFRVAETDNFEWVDVRHWRNIPKLIPASGKFLKDWRSQNPGEPEEPKWMVQDNADGTATKQLQLDIDISVGEGLPSNKMALYNIILSLSQLMLIDEKTGQPRPLVTFKRGKELIEMATGMILGDDAPPMATQTPTGSVQPLNMNMDSPSVSPGGGMVG